MKFTAANVITCVRIAGSLLLLVFQANTTAFSAIYLLCGLSDMIDGTVARKTNTASVFGAKLDTAADMLFFAAAFLKILPKLQLPTWIWVWAAVIVTIKLCNLTVGWLRDKSLLSLHTILNKLTGFLLFLFPLTVPIIDVLYTAPVVCIIALAAAIQEGYLVHRQQSII